MKKLLSLLMCVILILALIPAANARDSQTASPVIFICGFTGSGLYDETGYEMFPPVYDSVTAKDIVKLLPSLFFGLMTGQYGWMNRSLAQVFPNLLREFNCAAINADGSEDYPLTVYSHDPKLCRSRGTDYTLRQIAKGTGGIHYNFYTDFRKNVVDIADELDTFIDGVLADTGAQKVSLFGYSQGGSVAAAYLSEYGEKNLLDRVAFVNSPIFGTKTASSAMNIKNLDLSLNSLMKLAKFLGVDIGLYNELSNLIDVRFLNGALKAFEEEYLFPVALYWGGLWDMVPMDEYEPIKKMLLDETEQAWLIEKSDEYHYNVMANLDKTVADARANGTQVSFISGTDCRLVANDNYNGDGVVDTYGATMAFSTTHGKTFPAGYQSKGTVCTNPDHNHISPDRSLDASTCLLPENTWFNIGHGHCQYDEDPYMVELLTHLFCDDTIQDIHSDERFPQFHYGTSYVNSIGIRFGDQPFGYLSANDKQVTLINYCEEKATVKTIYVNGIPVYALKPIIIPSGEEVTVTLKLLPLPKADTAVKIRVDFKRADQKIPLTENAEVVYTVK